MLNFLQKSTTWVAALLLASATVFGQANETSQNSCAPKCPPKPCAKPCPQPTLPTQVCPADPCCPAWSTPVLNAAYNYPARNQTRCPWDINFDASFIFWQPIQENMEVGFLNETAVSDGTASSFNGNFLNLDADYKPGFKVGMGGYFDHDNWDLHAEYTWFHSNQSKSESISPDAALHQIYPTIGSPDLITDFEYVTAKEKWNLKMDIVDLDLGRWFYVGTKLTFRPSFGARAAWIRQHLSADYDNDAFDGEALEHIAVKQKSNSWAVGAKAALDTNWSVGSGFRVFGCGEADLLFTKYTSLSFSEEHTPLGVKSHTPFHAKQKNVYAVKPHLDLELGFGWGTYLDCNNWYMDFALGYGFQVFFDQNMFRHFTDTHMEFSSTSPNGNLYIQGLTATFKLDF